MGELIITNKPEINFKPFTIIVGCPGVGEGHLENALTALAREKQTKVEGLIAGPLRIGGHPWDQVMEVSDILKRSEAGLVNTLIYTFSPFVLQGFRYYAAQYKKEDQCTYYLAEVVKKGERWAEKISINCIDGDWREAFSQMAGPLNGIMNVDYTRETKEDL